MFFALSATAEAAYYKKSSELFRECASEASADAVSCVSYVIAVNDLAEVMAHADTGSKPAWCVPSAVTGGELRTAVLRYYGAYPARANGVAAAVVADALAAAYPCGEAGSQTLIHKMLHPEDERPVKPPTSPVPEVR
ncbi:MAG: hypothetical protein HY749_15930 [Gammaproteobacteria bacterium]|nr:hypothetical protein [Gammaproteobacteria bacterium]